ncbi:hypothetical protein [Paenibacillus sp. NPDC055715]
MKIWLLDVYSKTNAQLSPSFDAFSSSLVRRYDGQGFEAIPAHQEFQMIIIDFMNASDNQNVERIDQLQNLEKEMGTPQRKSIVYFNSDAVIYECSYAIRELSPKIQEALKAGIPVVVIAGELQHDMSSEEKKHNYTWLLNVHQFLTITDIAPKTGPISISYSNSDRAVKNLYEKFKKDLAWEVAFTTPQQENKPFFTRRKRNPKYFQSLFTNVKNQVVSFVLQEGNSELIVLPNIKNTEKRGHYIAYILNEFLPQFRPGWFPDRWAGAYTPNILSKKKLLLKVEKERLLQEFKYKEDQLQNQESIMMSFIDLLTQSDERLVVAVQRAFKEIFGAQITDLDLKRDLQNKPRLFDLIAIINSKRIAIEVKGGSRSLNKVMLNKVQDNLKAFRDEFPAREIYATLLILNDQYSKAPDKREPIAPQMIKDAKQRKITVLSTPILMEIMTMYLSGDLLKTDLLAILSKPGLVQASLK